VAEVKAYELDVSFNYESKPEKGSHIIDAEPSATISTTKIQPNEPDELEEGERIYHSQMWVNVTLLHFIIDNGSEKNLILAVIIKHLALATTLNP